MSTATLIIARRVLQQIRRDRRTLALLVILPAILMSLLALIYSGTQMLDRIAPSLFALFPFTVMFLVTSVATLRERTSGTLERTLSMPVHRIDFIGGYSLAFAVLSIVQTIVSATVVLWLLGLAIEGSLWQFFAVSLIDALAGTALGLLASAFARTEFQAVQFMPAVVFPQFMLCGLLVPRDQLPTVLEKISDVLPLSYAVDAIKKVSAGSGSIGTDMLVLLAFLVVFLALAAVSMRRRTA